MIKPRKIFYRRKGKHIAIEGTRSKKKDFIMTLPINPIDLIIALQKGSYFTREKFDELIKKVQGLDIKDPRSKKTTSKLRTINNLRTPNDDPFLD